MSDGEEFEGLGFNPKEFFAQLRKSASVKAGAIMFGQAQVAYYDALKEGMSEEQAYDTLARTTADVLRAMAQAAGPVTEAMLAAAAIYKEMMADEEGRKEMP